MHVVKPTPYSSAARRYDLDWLRVLAFGLLMLYHLGMLYVESWGYHYKSQYLSSSLEYLMLVSSPWRMFLIWFIAGFALAAVLQQYLGWKSRFLFGLKRTVVLLLPLLLGLWLIVPPQLYAEMVQKDGLELGYWQFYRAFFDLQHPLFADYQRGVWPHVDVNHLWFLRSLWTFTLLALVLTPLLFMRQLKGWLEGLFGMPLYWQLVLWSGLLLLIRYQFSGDSIRELQGLLFFLLGMLAVQLPVFWQRLSEARGWLGWFCCLNYLVLCGLYFIINQTELATEWVPGWLFALRLSFSVQGVAVTCWLLALAQRYLNRPHRYLSVANRAVFPCYLLHQTLLIVAALWLSPYALGAWLEASLVLLVTVLGSIGFVWIFWQLPWFAALVGLKTGYEFTARQRAFGYALGLLLVSPLAFRLLL